MFCPNCGNNCGDAKFCMVCGIKLSGTVDDVQKESLWKVGMACPYCGGNKLEGEHCAYCGAKLREETIKEVPPDVNNFVLRERKLLAGGVRYCPVCLSTSISKRDRHMGEHLFRSGRSLLTVLVSLVGALILFLYERWLGDACVCEDCGYTWNDKNRKLQERHKLLMENLLEGDPYREYDGAGKSSLRIAPDVVSIFRNGERKISIPYDHLGQVFLQSGEDDSYGWLTLGILQDRNEPVPKSIKEAELNPATMLIRPEDYEKYGQIYEVLKHIVNTNKSK